MAGNPEDRVHEREMTAHMRGLVDGCFEEGQYEAGLAALDQLRSPIYKPAAAHIRQLICIALCAQIPVKDQVPASPNGIKGKEVDYGASQLQLPSSINQQKSSFLPSNDATELARRLLVSFALTNTTSSLLRALPSYPLHPDSAVIGGRVDGAGLEFDGEDSYIAKLAQCIGSATNVWAVIKPGFIDWETKHVTGNAGLGRGKKRATRGKEEPTDDYDLLDDKSVSVIADYAWPVLEWLVLVFDKDEKQTFADDQHIYSPLLLSTLPSTRNNDPRWDAGPALDVVFTCLEDPDSERKLLGVKLLRQFINLTSTTLFDFQMFVGLVFNRLPIEDWDILGPFLANLPSSPAFLQFKLHLCIRYLNGVSRTRGAAPKKRAQPKATRRGISCHATSTDENDSSAGITRSIVRSYPALQWSTTIEPLLSYPLGDDPNSLSYKKIKFELLLTYGTLQGHQLPGVRDTTWDTALSAGTLSSIIDEVFQSRAYGDDDELPSQIMGELLLDMIPSFQIAVN